MKGRVKGKTALKYKITELKFKLAALTLKERLKWLLNDSYLLKEFKSLWLSERISSDLDYPIFFAVSEKSGKDNSGEPVYRRNEINEIVLDKYGHLIIDHDLNDISESFKIFVSEQNFNF